MLKTYKDIATDGGSGVLDQVTDQASRVASRMASIRHVVAVMSGKGGVGKSSVTVNLAAALAEQGQRVGVLDADLNSSSVARMTGVLGSKLDRGATGYAPATAALGLKVMSIDLFLSDTGAPVVWEAPTQRDAHTWRGMMEMAALREFIADTEWGELDFLLVDLPPGTDKLPNLVNVLPKLSGTIVVTIPTGISRYVVRKSIRMAVDVLQTPIVGLIENMAGHVCTHCGHEDDLFPDGDVRGLATELDVPYLGRIPFDPRVALAADEGEMFLAARPRSTAANAFRDLAEQTTRFFSASPVTAA